MPTFRYQTLAGSNGSAAAVIEAPDRAAALRQLRVQGVTPTRLETISKREAKKEHAKEAAKPSTGMQAPAAAAASSFSFSRPGMNRVELSMFIRELATAVQAGLPLVQSLKTIERQIRHAGQKAMVGKIIHEVEHGRSLADACRKVGKPFGELTISLIRGGEASGRLGETLEHLATLLDRDVKIRRMLVSALIYPAILAFMIVIAIVIMILVIVPRILAPFAGKLTTSQLPLPTRVVIGIGDVFGGYWWAILIAVALVLIVFQNAYKRPAGRLSIDRAMLKLPLMGAALRDVAVARFTRTLGTLVSAGLPALTALRVTKATLGNRAMEQVVEQVCEAVSSGKTISEPMEKSGHFPSLLTQIIGLGERSGRLPQMLNQAATVFEERTETRLKVVASILPVAMVLLAACVIGFVMAGVLLPLIQMQDLIGR
jgi:type II secretory pathway component PulF